MEMGTSKIAKNGNEIPLFSELKIQVYVDRLDGQQTDETIQQWREVVGEIEDLIKLYVLLPNNFRLETK